MHAFPFISAQDEYSLLVRDIEKELIPAAKAYGKGLLPYYPLASGLLTGKYKRGAEMPAGTRFANEQRHVDRYMSDVNWKKTEALRTFAEERGHTLLELAFSWLACREPVASVIAGATKPEQVALNIKAAGWKLTAEDMAEVDRISGGA